MMQHIQMGTESKVGDNNKQERRMPMKELTKQPFHLRLTETENQKKGGQFMKSKLIQLIMCLVLIAGFSLSVAVAADESQAALKAQAKITQKEATKTALTKVPNGKIESAELEKEHGKLIWSFDISMPNSKNITEVQVDAKTGKIVSTKVETPKDQAKEAAADKKQKKQ
jgi:uncharacterized membrane protein YkoI